MWKLCALRCEHLLQQTLSKEEYYLLGYIAEYSVESQPMFRRSVSPPS
jgi:hypothetical protein